MLEEAYFEAFYQHNAKDGREWLKQAKGSLVANSTRLRVEAAVLLAEGNLKEASAKAGAGLAALKSDVDLRQAKAEEDWLHQILQLTQV